MSLRIESAVVAALLAFPALAAAADRETRIEVGPLATPRLSVPLGSLPVAAAPHAYVVKANDRVNPLAHEADQGRRGTWEAVAPPDPLAARGVHAGGRTPDPLLTFAGTGNPVGCGGCSPPDTVGDVGPHHYVQMVNATKVAIYSKGGTLLGGPFDLSTLFTSGNCTGNDGDPVVVYDPLADRWVLTQFAGPQHLCFAVSQTADPLGAYWIYTFVTTNFPDYFKVGVWPDGYYVSTNEAEYNAWVVEREVMLVGGPSAQSIKATTFAANFLLPADVDGIVAPPPGAPNVFYTFLDNSFHGGSDRLELREFAVDWETSTNSTFTVVASPTVAAYEYTVCGFFNFNCAPQSGTAQTVDVVSEWPMFRFAYRSYPTHQALVGNFAVDVGSNRSGIRWFELRDTGSGWTLFQEGTLAPADTAHRFMGSIAQDREGSIALGFTRTASTEFPSIRYTTRLASDPAGTLGPEAVLFAGAGSQTGSNRWGDYSAMAIDPADDCTFWFTNEYYAASSGSTWATRIGAFRVPECLALFLDNFETGGTTRWSSLIP